MKGRGGQNDDLLPSNKPQPLTQQVNDLALFFFKLGSRGRCLLPSTFAKVEIDVEGTTFPQGLWKLSTLNPGRI